MKTLTSLRIAILPFLLLPFLASAQQKAKFTINEPFKKSTYGDQLVSKMKWKELKTIMMATGDEEIVRNMRKISGKNAGNLTCIVIGDLMMAGGLAVMLADGDGGTGLLAGGAGMLVVGAIVGSGSKGLLKRSMLRYNTLNGGTSLVPGTTTIDGQTALGASLTVRF